ncbi:MAG: FKBP-type peptidyl-prolyl cis-trans isomerase N-terminal domain-containing protein, partial [Bacteroidetes bacterium]|nr:FKBP-type peptidyl-prolyl cis-trans isomerase N-terminal domain-containing protein [Bacteroidota bacterium]
MPTRASLLLLAFAIAFVGWGNDGDVSSPNLDNIHDQAILEQASYLFGYQMGDAARAQMDSTVIADLDMDIMLAAVREGLSGDSLRYEPLALRRVTRVIDDTLLLRSLRREAAEAMITQEFFDEVLEGTRILEGGARNGAIGDTLQISNGDFIHVMVTDTLLLSNGLSFSEMRRQLAPGKFLD